MRCSWVTGAVLVLTWAPLAHADEPAIAPIVITADPPAAEPMQLPPVVIQGDVPHAPAQVTLVIDPTTGLMIPHFDDEHPRRSRRSASRARAPRYAGLHIDRVTGLLVPDFVEHTGPNGTGTTASDLVVDPATGLMVPASMLHRHGRGRGL